ncbi:MAG: hypothetical protein NTU93_00120 [Arthrobacter sp.]|nr:hypothetical protein [Arthrobacter sp.]
MTAPTSLPTGPLRLAELPPGPTRACAEHLAANHGAAALRAMQRSPVPAGDCARWDIVPAEWRCAVAAALGEVRVGGNGGRPTGGQTRMAEVTK